MRLEKYIEIQIWKIKYVLRRYASNYRKKKIQEWSNTIRYRRNGKIPFSKLKNYNSLINPNIANSPVFLMGDMFNISQTAFLNLINFLNNFIYSSLKFLREGAVC